MLEINNNVGSKKLETDFGCPLEVVFKALKGINYVDESGYFSLYPRPRLYYSDDLKTKETIDKMHKANIHKLLPMPKFVPSCYDPIKL